MLAAHMVGLHNAAMDCLRRGQSDFHEPERQREDLKLAIRLSEVFGKHVERIAKYRGKGPQRIKVEHVHVNEGGQAIVGTVNSAGGGLRNHPAAPTHGFTAVGYRPEQSLGELQREPQPRPQRQPQGAPVEAERATEMVTATTKSEDDLVAVEVREANRALKHLTYKEERRKARRETLPQILREDAQQRAFLEDHPEASSAAEVTAVEPEGWAAAGEPEPLLEVPVGHVISPGEPAAHGILEQGGEFLEDPQPGAAATRVLGDHAGAGTSATGERPIGDPPTGEPGSLGSGGDRADHAHPSWPGWRPSLGLPR